MDPKISKVLKIIESNGFEAYIIGGFVRDYLLGIKSIDVDICTNALPKDIIKIFNIKKETASYGSISFSDGTYNYDITTYRKESDYSNRKPQQVEYTSNLLLDITRRDFTINTICMNTEGKVFDYINGIEDLNNKLIRVVGDTNTKLTEDPLRILRAIRFAVILDFKLSDDIINFIKNNKKLIGTLSYTRRKEELDKILVSKNCLNGLKLLKEFNLTDVLEIKYDKILPVSDVIGMWSQIEFNSKYPFTKASLSILKNVKNIVGEGNITNKDLFNYGLYACNVAADILDISKETINIMYQNMQIHDRSELVINSRDIINILDIEPSQVIKDIYNEVLYKVIDGSLLNNYDDIKNYILNMKE